MDSVLYKTITSGDTDQLKQLIASDGDLLLQQMTPLKNTVLHVSVQFNRRECVEEICKRYPSSLLTESNSKGDTPLHLAAKLGLSDIASVLIKQSKINQVDDIESGGVGNYSSRLQQLVRMRNKENDTALHEAVRNHCLEVVKLLTEADPEFKYFECNNAGETPLYLAVEEELYDGVVQILQTCPSSAHSGPLGRTALHVAVVNNSTDIVTLLLEKKQSTIIKEADKFGCSALHYAAYYGNVEMVNKLLEADPSVGYMADKDGKTAFHAAASMHFTVGVIEELTRHCPDCWEMIDNKGQNFLHVAAANRVYTLFRYFNSHESEMVKNLINQPDDNGNTPLHLATMSTDIQTAKTLCRNDRVNKRSINKDNLTALDLVKNQKGAKKYLGKAGVQRRLRNQIIHREAYAETQIKEDGTEKEATVLLHPKNTNQRRKEELDVMHKISDTHLLVATLIATVTFAAGFTPPGGYNSDGPNKGMPVLTRNPAFITFLISNTTAILLSTFTVFAHFLSKLIVVTHEEKDYDTMVNLVRVAYWCTLSAMATMVLAFVSGMFAVLLVHLPGLSVLLFLLTYLVFINLSLFLGYKALDGRTYVFCKKW